MNLTALRDEVKSRIQNRGDLTDTVLDRYIDTAYKNLCTGKFIDASGRLRSLRFPELELRLDSTLSTGTEAYAVNDRTYSIIIVTHQFDSTNDRWLNLEYLPPARYTEIPVTEGRPYFYTFFQNAIRVRPVPSSAWNGTTMRTWQYMLPSALGGGSAEPVIPDHWHLLIAVLAASRLASRFGFTELVTHYEAEFRSMLATMPTPYEMQSHIHATRSING